MKVSVKKLVNGSWGCREWTKEDVHFAYFFSPVEQSFETSFLFQLIMLLLTPPYLRLCLHLVPKHGARVWFSPGTNVNTPFSQVPSPEFRHDLLHGQHGNILGTQCLNTAPFCAGALDHEALVFGHQVWTQPKYAHMLFILPSMLLCSCPPLPSQIKCRIYKPLI